jgi:hypothetical protein
MNKFEFRVGVHDGLIVVTDAVYAKPADQQRLILERRRPTKDQRLVAEARNAANANFLMASRRSPWFRLERLL